MNSMILIKVYINWNSNTGKFIHFIEIVYIDHFYTNLNASQYTTLYIYIDHIPITSILWLHLPRTSNRALCLIGSPNEPKVSRDLCPKSIAFWLHRILYMQSFFFCQNLTWNEKSYYVQHFDGLIERLQLWHQGGETLDFFDGHPHQEKKASNVNFLGKWGEASAASNSIHTKTHIEQGPGVWDILIRHFFPNLWSMGLAPDMPGKTTKWNRPSLTGLFGNAPPVAWRMSFWKAAPPKNKKHAPRWWFQPIWKICSSDLDYSPRDRGENSKKYVKPQFQVSANP